jgi:hypothetical protein
MPEPITDADLGRSYLNLIKLRATAERLGFWDDVRHWDAVLAAKRDREVER